MAPLTIAPPNTPQNRFVSPWLNWDNKSLVSYDMKRPEGYKEVLADARYLINKIEKRNPDWYPRIRSRDVWESLFGVSAEHEHSYHCARIEGHVLDPEDMNRALVRKFFLWPRHEVYITTNQGREVPYRIANNPRNLTAQENPLLLGSYNTQKPRDATEAHQNARRNRAIYESGLGPTLRCAARTNPFAVWAMLPSRTAEDLILFFNFWVRPDTELGQDLFAWSAHADEKAGVRLAQQLLDGDFDNGSLEDIYNALLVDNDFVDLLKERF